MYIFFTLPIFTLNIRSNAYKKKLMLSLHLEG
jgi:hypothetical protein